MPICSTPPVASPSKIKTASISLFSQLPALYLISLYLYAPYARYLLSPVASTADQLSPRVTYRAAAVCCATAATAWGTKRQRIMTDSGGLANPAAELGLLRVGICHAVQNSSDSGSGNVDRSRMVRVEVGIYIRARWIGVLALSDDRGVACGIEELFVRFCWLEMCWKNDLYLK